MGVGSLRKIESMATQPFASVMVATYKPVSKPKAFCVFCPLDQEYEYGAVPPVPTTLAVPSEALKQLICCPL